MNCNIYILQSGGSEGFENDFYSGYLPHDKSQYRNKPDLVKIQLNSSTTYITMS